MSDKTERRDIDDEESVGEVGGYPTPGIMGGGAGGIATSGADRDAPTDDAEVRPTSHSDPHGFVAESADIGQHPLRDYKLDADSPSGASTGSDAPLTPDVTEEETLTSVRQGFKVVDVNGDEVGSVRDLRSGDRDAATGDDAEPGGRSTEFLAAPAGGSSGAGGGIGIAGGVPPIVAEDDNNAREEPNVSEPAYSRLSRLGFIKIDSKGWFASDRYADADQVARVEGDTVYLSVAKEDLIPER